MPVHKGSDNRGNFFQYGTTGKRYYYKTDKGEKLALNRANKQGKAIQTSKKLKISFK
jgi:hypothetical protein